MRIHRGIIALAVPLMAASLLVGAAPAANAATPKCTKANLNKLRYETGNKKFTWVVVQNDREENFSGKEATIKFEVSKGTTQANNVNFAAGAKGTVKGVWASFEASIGVEVGSATTKTEFAKVTREYKLKSGDSYIFGQGTGRHTATVTTFECQKWNADGDGYVWRNVGKATVKGHTGKTHAVVGCKQKPGSSTFSYKLKQAHC